MTSMPSATAASATSTPIAPSPITPNFLPLISVPAKAFFAFSIVLLIAASALLSATHCIPPRISLAASSIPAITSSFTPFAFAPGVLNTTIPFSAHLSSGILLTPAPALATASRLSGSSSSCIAALLTRTASASAKLSVVPNVAGNKFIPILAIGFKQLTFIIFLTFFFRYYHFCRKKHQKLSIVFLL